MDGTGSTAAARSVGIAGREGREEVAPSAGCWCPRGPPAERKKYIHIVQDLYRMLWNSVFLAFLPSAPKEVPVFNFSSSY